MRRRTMLFSIILSLSALVSACGPSASGTPVQLTISAAASLTDSLQEIQKLYEAENTSVKLTFNFGSSGALQKQIEQGAPADLFLSAGSKQMKELVDRQLIEPAKQKNLLSNELVVIVPAAKTSSALTGLQDLANPTVTKLSVADPETVPAGSYAKESLSYYQLWPALQSKLVPAKDVRQVLTYVESGNVDAGIVYKTDALTSSKVKTAFTVSSQSHKPIEYPAGIVKATKHPKEAEAFYQFLQEKRSGEIFVKYGFSIPARQ